MIMKIKDVLIDKTERKSKAGDDYVTLTIGKTFIFCWKLSLIEGIKEGDICEAEYSDGKFKNLQSITFTTPQIEVIPMQDKILKQIGSGSYTDDVVLFLKANDIPNPDNIILKLLEHGEIFEDKAGHLMVLQ